MENMSHSYREGIWLKYATQWCITLRKGWDLFIL